MVRVQFCNGVRNYQSLTQRISTSSLGIRGCRKFSSKLGDLDDEVVNPDDPESAWLVNKKYIPFVEKNDLISIGESYTTPTLTSLERGMMPINFDRP